MLTLRFTLLLCLGVVSMVQAQTPTLYKWVNEKGKVTYSDLPPPASARQAEPVDMKYALSKGMGGIDLPYELARAMQSHPVILYTSEQCAPCAEGRQLLNERGVPFTEKRVVNDEERNAYRSLVPTLDVPMLMVGKEKLVVFDRNAWNQALTNVGYPTTNKLPKNANPVRQNNENETTPVKKVVPEKVKSSLPNRTSRQPVGNVPPDFQF